tara:strand:+ start:750 stop:1244 length:495 start_codon:yes stop_codon:yes gene_type:complete
MPIIETMNLNNDDIKNMRDVLKDVKNYDNEIKNAIENKIWEIDYKTSKYIIKYNLNSDGVRYYYTIEPIEMTDNWFLEFYDLYAPITKTKCRYITLGVDKEYLFYNENEVATDLFNIKVAGDVVFSFSEDENGDDLTAEVIEEELKKIKNYLVSAGMNYKNIKI